jgi:hypothetical protein
MKLLVRGEDMRPWYQETEDRWLIFTRRGLDINRYPSIKSYLEQFRDELEPRPKDWDTNKEWHGRKAGSYKWYETQDPVDYYQIFEKSKIIWPGIGKFPRFSWDDSSLLVNDAGFFLIPTDRSLLGILQSRVSWFCITKLCASLGERNDLIRYQQKIQFIRNLPIPQLTAEQQNQISRLSHQLTCIAQNRYRVRRDMAQRVKNDLGTNQSKITDRLDEWWQLDWQGFRDEVRKSFKQEIPIKERAEWQEFFQEQRNEIGWLTAEIVRLEEELNTAVYAVYGLNEEEIALIEQETKYAYGEW